MRHYSAAVIALTPGLLSPHFLTCNRFSILHDRLHLDQMSPCTSDLRINSKFSIYETIPVRKSDSPICHIAIFFSRKPFSVLEYINCRIYWGSCTPNVARIIVSGVVPLGLKENMGMPTTSPF